MELDFTLERNIVEHGDYAEVRWIVVRRSDDEIVGDHSYLYEAEEEVIRRTLAKFLLESVQQAMDTDEGEQMWERLTQFIHYSPVKERCEACDRVITNSLPAAVQLMADSLIRGQESVDRTHEVAR